jgi:hypothetical protein
MRKESRAVLRTFSPILAEHVLELLAVARQCCGSGFFNQKMPAVTSGGTCSMCGTIMKHLARSARKVGSFALPTAVRLILIARPRRLAHWDAALASINFVAHALASS